MNSLEKSIQTNIAKHVHKPSHPILESTRSDFILDVPLSVKLAAVMSGHDEMKDLYLPYGILYKVVINYLALESALSES